MGEPHKKYSIPPSIPALNGKITYNHTYTTIKEENDQLKYSLDSWGWKTLCDIIYRKPHCKICSNPKDKDSECTGHNPSFEELDRTIAIGEHIPIRYHDLQNKLSELNRSLKDSPDPIFILAPALAFVLEHKLGGIGPEAIDYFTYVPELKEEYKENEGIRFNQSHLLTLCLKKFIDKPILNLFAKTFSFSFQHKSPSERRRLARKGYELRTQKPCRKCADTNIGIVDDLRTTGATGNRFATLLKEKCSAKKVFLLVAGRTHWEQY